MKTGQKLNTEAYELVKKSKSCSDYYLMSKTFPFLLKNNFLSEFVTDKEKAKVLENLGIADIIREISSQSIIVDDFYNNNIDLSFLKGSVTTSFYSGESEDEIDLTTLVTSFYEE